MTLGAQSGRILWMVLREVFALAVIGMIIGLPLALSGSRYLRSFLYGIEPNDPLTIAFALAMLLLSGALAGFVPARRASRIDPMTAVRHE
jgi:ABC-type antimicrobial peptide transport system permease subunit